MVLPFFIHIFRCEEKCQISAFRIQEMNSTTKMIWHRQENEKFQASLKIDYFLRAESMKEAGNVFSHANSEKAAGSRGLGRVQALAYRPHEIHFFVSQFSRLDKPRQPPQLM